MRHVAKRILALALTAVMLLGMLPVDTHASAQSGTATQSGTSQGGRTVLNFNNDWRFYEGELAGRRQGGHRRQPVAVCQRPPQHHPVHPGELLP